MEALCITFVAIISLVIFFGKIGSRFQGLLNDSYREAESIVRHPAGYPRTKTDCYEIAYSFESEDCVYQSYNECEKNPQHDGFIPINDVSIVSFPPYYQTQSLVDLTFALAAVTVKLSIFYVSEDRPKTFADKEIPYPFGETSGKSIFLKGSGRIRFVNKYPFYDNKTCPCARCTHSTAPKKDWWMVGVVTAAHVVFDEKEAKSTRCRVDYNTEVKELKPENSLQGYGIAERGVFVEEDRSNVLFCTHDSSLAAELESRVAHYKAQCEKVVEEFQDNAERELVIVVSHPHGRAKCASIGRAERRLKVETGFTKYEYSVATCPGTSGAPVYMLDRTKLPFCNHPHSAAFKEKDNSGYSAGGY
ncbi:unnamed protein product [Lymnaea stagnalis]|uniref:Uncharacterized protein n=1 Tax=Lymnaea stagnalis TaxID=6523 RepID=A0AAV2H3F2_LYMST